MSNNKTHALTFRVNETELRVLREAAAAEMLAPGTYIRRVAMRDASRIQDERMRSGR